MQHRFIFQPLNSPAIDHKHIIAMPIDSTFEQQYQTTLLNGNLSDRVALLIQYGFVCRRCGQVLKPADSFSGLTESTDRAVTKECVSCRREPVSNRPSLPA